MHNSTEEKEMGITEYLLCTCAYHSDLFLFISDHNKTALLCIFTWPVMIESDFSG